MKKKKKGKLVILFLASLSVFAAIGIQGNSGKKTDKQKEAEEKPKPTTITNTNDQEDKVNKVRKSNNQVKNPPKVTEGKKLHIPSPSNSKSSTGG
ncbi:hypothetical protein [Thermoflavimicrobium daqui]|nr:hypothetical protein [Thermoflavimicrobium daqui]